MGYIVEILLAIGIRSAGVEALIAFITRLSGTAFFRSSFVRNKLISWAGGILSLAEGVHWLEDVVKKYFSEMFGEKVKSLLKEDLLPAAGRSAAKEFNKQMEERYGITCPIENFYSETLAEEFGQWIADIINEKVSERMGRDVHIVTTVFPPDQLPADIDEFLTDEINLKLGLNLTSVFFNPNLAEDLKTALRDKFSEEVTNMLERVKGKVINELQTGEDFDASEAVYAIQAITQAFNNARTFMDEDGMFGLPMVTNAYYSSQKKKIANKMRQREWRKTHREQRIWVIR